VGNRSGQVKVKIKIKNPRSKITNHKSQIKIPALIFKIREIRMGHPHAPNSTSSNSTFEQKRMGLPVSQAPPSGIKVKARLTPSLTLTCQ